MNTVEIILKKRNGNTLSYDELTYMINGFINGLIPEYQMSAFLMSIWYSKLNKTERADLTRIMINSGKCLDFSNIPGIKVDKHSTGGVGDGTSLAIAPIVAAAGGIVPMMSGRGLGHTGGTLDKLESIPGFQVNLSEKEINKILSAIHVVMMGQTGGIVPADKMIYALRDVTATIDSIDLISASIMSKKIAEGMDSLVLDVKTGNGAFMQKMEDAVALAGSMVEIAESFNKKMFAYITDMNLPLGLAVGNALEMIQIIEILKGKGPGDLKQLIILLSARMLVLSEISADFTDAQKLADKMISSGLALEKLEQMIKYQKGNPKVISDYSVFPQAGIKEDFTAVEQGYISSMDTFKIGQSAVLLGAGREELHSKIDPAAGYIFHKKTGEKVKKGEPILTVYANDQKRLNAAKEKLLEAVKISNICPEPDPLIYGYVTREGFQKNEIKRVV